MSDQLFAFIGLAAVLVAIPGPAVVLIMKSAVIRGRGSAISTAVGVLSGDLVWVSASVTGVTTVLVASRPAFAALRLVGAAYLVWLGVRLIIRRGFDSLLAAENADPTATLSERRTRRAFAEGALCELSNPKTLVVFTSVMPPFVPEGGGLGDVALLGAIFAVLGFLSLLTYALVLGAARRIIRRPVLARRLLRGSGAVLVAFGLGLAADGPRGS